MRPYIDYKKCNLSKKCVEVCPMKVFVEVKGKVIVKNPQDCIGCRACEVQCPQAAIIVKE